METRTRIALLGLMLFGCQPSSQQAIDSFVSGNHSAQIPAAPIQPIAHHQPHQLKLTLKLDHPSDLKIKAQEQVTQGQVLSDRISKRNQLTQQRDRLQAQLSHLQYDKTPPPNTTATEAAQVRAARVALVEAKKAIANYQRDLPWTDYAHQVLPIDHNPHLVRLQQKVERAKAGLAIAEGKLQDAQNQSPANLSKVFRQESKLLRRMLVIEEQLKNLGVVKSPYDGKIKSIKWVGQSDQELQVVVTLITQTASESDASQIAQTGADPELWTVLSIHDGDTIKVRRGNQEERIRFACVDAPELKQPFGPDSLAYLRSLLAGNPVRLEMTDRDRFGRQVAQVYLPSGQLVQQLQAAAGMTYLYEKHIGSCPSASEVRSAQDSAKAQKIGVWSGKYQTPWNYRKSIRK